MDSFAPVSYDVVWTVLAAATAVLALLALHAWFRDGPTGLVGLVGVLLILLVPVIGPAAYLLSRRPLRAGPVDSRRPPVSGPG